MSQRLRVQDLIANDFPKEVGLCANDFPRIYKMANRSELRLLQAKESGDEGWYGSWAEMRFNVQQSAPSIVLPREVARVEAMAVCRHPIPVRNQFYEFAQFGNGRLHRQFIQTLSNGVITNVFGNCFGLMDLRTRNNVPTFLPITNPPQFLVAALTNPGDAEARVLFQGLDPSNNVIYSQDGTTVPVQNVQGQYVSLLAPFVKAPIPMNQITGIQKDQTLGPVQIFQMDPNTGAQVLIHTMEPSETTGWYRRYLFNGLPVNCCADPRSAICNPLGGPPLVQVSAIVKLEHIDVQATTDYLVLQNIEAFMEESKAIRYRPIDTADAKSMAAEHHKNAIAQLNGELAHYLGIDEPTVTFAPFGSAKLTHQRIGTLI